MRTYLINVNESAEKTFLLVFKTGEEVLEGLRAFAQEQPLQAAHFTAIGAFRDVTLGFFDMEHKNYSKTAIEEQVEVLSLDGNIALNKGKPEVHAHVVVGKRDGRAYGGHILQAHVRPTLELILVELPAYLQRETDAATGLALIQAGGQR